MHDDQTTLPEPDDGPTPVRQPTGREKFSVLLPALIAFLGLVAMLITFVVLVLMIRS